MSTISADDPVAVTATKAVHSGDLDGLASLLREHPDLATVRIGTDGPDGVARTLLHAATDWPGHYPSNPAVARMLIDAGADVNARVSGPHTETPLHWAASSDHIEVLDVLLDAGADLESSGAVIGGGTPLSDAVAFGQWNAARRLIERGAHSELWEAAALGLMDRVEAYWINEPPPTRNDSTHAFWCACHGGQRIAAEYLLARGADMNWIGYDDLTPMDAAKRSGATDLVDWLRGRGAKAANPLS